MAPKGSASQTAGNPTANKISMIKSLLSGNPQQIYAQEYNSNPLFRQFADSMYGKTPEEACRTYEQQLREKGYDVEQVVDMLK